MIKTTLTLCILATPLAAQTPLTGDQFDELSQGGTYTFTYPGEAAYGIELYLPDRQVIWAFLAEDQCIEGYWYEDTPGELCFVYPELNQPDQCWNVFLNDGKMTADFIGDFGVRLAALRPTSQTMPCLGEYLGF